MNVINRIKLMSLALLVSCSLSTIFAIEPQAKTEAEKIAYLKSVINPGKTHEFLVKNSAVVAGLLGQIYLKHKLFTAIREKVIQRHFFTNDIHDAIFNNPWVGHSVKEKTQLKKNKTRDFINSLGILLFPLSMLVESNGAAFLQTELLKNEAQDLIIPHLGGICGTLLYSAYHKLFFSNKRCLERTLDAFNESPEMFPTATHKILEDTEKTFTTMDAKAIASVCKALRALTEPA